MTDEEKFDALREITRGRPYVLVTVQPIGDPDGIGVALEAGGGITSMGEIRKMLTLAVDAVERQR